METIPAEGLTVQEVKKHSFGNQISVFHVSCVLFHTSGFLMEKKGGSSASFVEDNEVDNIKTG